MKKYKKLEIKDVYEEVNSFQQLSLVNDLIFGLRSLYSGDKSRNAIFVRPFDRDELSAQNLTGNNFKIKSNFHGYGGKAYKCLFFNEKYYLIWIDQITNSLWLQVFVKNKSESKDLNFLLEDSIPRQLTAPLSGNFDASFVIFKELKLFGLYEQDDKDYLFSINLDNDINQLIILREFEGFACSLSCNEDQTFLSWIEWKQDNMSWEKNDLFFAEIDLNGKLLKTIKFKNRDINLKKSVSFFQPYWISKNILICSEDSSGWWNLLFLEISTIDQIIIKKRIKKESFEYGFPEWTAGESVFSGSNNNLFCLAKNKDFWILENYQNFAFYQKIDLPFRCLKDLHVSSNKLICIASSDSSHEQLLKIDMDYSFKILNTPKANISKNFISFVKPYVYWFKGYCNKDTHAWIYNPFNEDREKLPLLLRAHSGPTSSFNGTLNLEVQYWLSRGWCVAEVNYGGSSGFGREYRERLNMNWGIVDSFDCINLAKSLIKKKTIDPSRIIISGNSAGGLTALNSLIQSDIFKAAICKYPVIDLNEMRLNTHRFERYYLNSLVGKYKLNKRKYIERSPKNNLHKLDKPILLFHGKKDSVINFKESVYLNKKLLEKNIFSKVFLFDEEGHGFKKQKNKKFVLEKTEEFIQYIFNV